MAPTTTDKKSVPTSLPTSDTKVLVKSRYREVVVKTGHYFERVVNQETGRVSVNTVYYYRRFHASSNPNETCGYCYMTPQEAENIVEAKWNNVNGYPEEYMYPSGMPMPVALDYGGADLVPPMTDAGQSQADPRTLADAQVFKAQQDEALALFQSQMRDRAEAER
jgi:hypothetical protein